MIMRLVVKNLIVAITGAAACVPSFAAAASRRPNIVVIVGDDMGYADIGIHGCKDIPTPNIDALANSGVRCTNGYVSAPYCSPSRAGMLTGRFQTRFGHEFNPSGEYKGPDNKDDAPNEGLPLSETTIADRLKANGYVTGLVGKWHLGSGPKFQPPQRGFSEFFGFLGGSHPYVPGKGAPIYRNMEPVKVDEYLTDAIGREAVEFVERHAEHPFFLYLAFNAVHTPMEADKARLEKFQHIADKQRRTYAAMMSAMDDAIGKVVAKLREEKLAEDTLVFFLSDNGGPTMRGVAVNGSRNDPLRGSKRTTLEGGIRVPFFVSWPGQLPAGKVYDRPVIQLDIAPTALAASNTTADNAKFDGVNLLPYLRGENVAAPHDVLFWRFGSQMAIREGDWKLVRYDAAADGRKPGATKAKLYDLSTDIGESRDQITAEPELTDALQATWDDWNAVNVPPRWAPGPVPVNKEKNAAERNAKNKNKRRAPVTN